MARATGWQFEFVTLHQHPEFRNLWGYVQYSRPLETRADLDLWAPTFLAGQFGEAALLGFAGPGGSQDNAMVLEHVRAHLGSGDAGRMYFERAFHQAREYVMNEKTALRTVATTLIEREHLSRTEIEHILDTPVQ